jgi:uncharacterized protein (UPF0248 family)
MKPLHELLHRIRWDPEFGNGRFELAYVDRVAGQDQIVPLAAIHIDEASGMFTFTDEDGVVRRIPLHRVRTVYKDGVVVWRRPDSS